MVVNSSTLFKIQNTTESGSALPYQTRVWVLRNRREPGFVLLTDITRGAAIANTMGKQNVSNKTFPNEGYKWWIHVLITINSTRQSINENDWSTRRSVSDVNKNTSSIYSLKYTNNNTLWKWEQPHWHNYKNIKT